MSDSGHAGAIPPPELRIVKHGLWQRVGETARLRCGVFGHAPVAAVVADRGLLVADVDSGDVLLESTAPDGTVCRAAVRLGRRVGLVPAILAGLPAAFYLLLMVADLLNGDNPLGG